MSTRRDFFLTSSMRHPKHGSITFGMGISGKNWGFFSGASDSFSAFRAYSNPMDLKAASIGSA